MCLLKLTFSFFTDCISRSRIAGSYGDSTFSFMRKLHAVFPSDCTNLYFHKLCTSGVAGGSCGRRLCLGLSLHNPHPLSYLMWSPNSGLRFWTSSPSARASGLSGCGGRVMVHQTTLGVHRRPWNRYTGNSGDKKLGSSGI